MAKYPDLKSYLQANFADLFKTEIQKFVDGSYDGSGFHSINVLSLCRHEIDNVGVKALRCHDDIGPRIKMDVGISADIVELGLGTHRYEADRKKQWFTVYLRGVLLDGLTDIEVLDVDEYDRGHFEKESALDQFLVPYIYSADLEDKADDFTAFYCCNAFYEDYKFPVFDVLQDMDIKCYTADLPENCFGRMYFRPARATVYDVTPYGKETKLIDHEIEPGTMVISRQKFFLGNYGTRRLTIAHEIIHWYLHQKYFRLLGLLDSEADMMSCEVEPNFYDDCMTGAQKAHWYAEWQANALSLRIAMPQKLVLEAFQQVYQDMPAYKFAGQLVEDLLKRVAKLFDVPRFIAKQRARQLDFDIADGAFVYVDGKHYDPFSFAKGTLDQHQTFVIDEQAYKRLYMNDPDYAALIDSGRFVYTGYVTCINAPKYIDVDISSEHAGLKLTDYAREHADECCLKYSLRSTSYMKEEFEFYGQAYLSKEVRAERYVEPTYDKNFNEKCLQSSEEIAAEVKRYNVEMDKIEEIEWDISNKKCKTFGDLIIYHMNRKNIKIEELAERSLLSDKTINNYRANKVHHPPIENVMAICIGLNLHEFFCLELLKAAGYQLEWSNRESRAYRLLLEYTDGTIYQWNSILDAYGLPHIPNRRNQKN